jgi:hypothetical protein
MKRGIAMNETVARSYLVFGRVIDRETKRGIRGLTVEAWDKDMIVDDLVGTAITGERGAFQIRFDESDFFDGSDFKDLFLVRRPDLYFRVYRGDELIESTEDSVLWNVQREDIEVQIEVDDSADEEPQPGDETAPGLQAATRSILQATYTPRQPRPGEDPSMAPRALEKAAFFARLAPSQEELGELANRYGQEPTHRDTGDTTATEKALEAVEILCHAVSPTGEINVLRSGKQFAGLEVETLVRIAQDLIELRQETLNTVRDAQATILEEFAKAGSLGTGVRTMLSVPSVRMRTLMDWAVRNNIQGESAARSLSLAQSLSLDVQTLKPDQFLSVAARQITRLRSLVNAFREEMDVERVGYLHLERMSFAPAGIERGELVYSVPLSPGEEVNIKHREWSQISEEFERIVTDYLEEFSEDGVTEKLELAESVNSQTQHSTAFNTGVTASGSYGPVSITTTLGYNASDSSSKSEQLSRNQSTDITHKASSRAKKEHKISFRVASVVETEDETVQRIRNPFPDRATRVDYYQLLRKWQVNLYRYGIRLTYDIAIPEPGSGLLAKISEIRQLKQDLQTEYEFPHRLSDITREEYGNIAATYGAEVQPPPVDNPPPRSDHWEKHWHDDPAEADRSSWVSMSFNVEKDYEVADFWIDSVHHVKHPGPPVNEVQVATPDGLWRARFDKGVYEPKEPEEWLQGISGQIVFTWRFAHLVWVWATALVNLTLRAEAFPSWQLDTYKRIYDAAYARDIEARIRLKERLSRLEEELGAQDALSLRKREREEVMKKVLTELGFPPEEKDVRLNPRIIKFLHHAIEWENMLYFLYPYFWSDPDEQIGSEPEAEEQTEPYWEFKKYLDHPDPMHRAFLKAGCARVVLTIRPDYEDAFMAFVNEIEFDKLPPAPYLEIGKEFEAHAKTNYPGIPPANPVDSFRPLLTPMQKKTWERMRLLIRLLEVFHRANRRYPLTTEEKGETLEALRQVFPMKDPWDRDYVYHHPSQDPDRQVDYDLASYGADGKLDSEEEEEHYEDEDIANWDPAFKKELPEQAQAWEDIQLIAHLLDEYYKLHEAYPSTQEGLEALKQLIPLKDAWGNDYVYTCPGVHGEYDLASYGADGKRGGEGEDADITSWAEASLIGQWYEYTPTSALDIAFDEEMPAV